MGLFNSSTGRTQILTYDFIFGDGNKVAIEVNEIANGIPSLEYVRLWAHHFAKLIYDFGPNNKNTVLGIDHLEHVIKQGINAQTNCFQASMVGLLFQYTERISAEEKRISNEYYGKGAIGRAVATHFNFLSKTGNEQALISTIALMQYCINRIQSEDEHLAILGRTASNMLDQYQSGKGEAIQDIVGIPVEAYMKAVDNS